MLCAKLRIHFRTPQPIQTTLTHTTSRSEFNSHTKLVWSGGDPLEESLLNLSGTSGSFQSISRTIAGDLVIFVYTRRLTVRDRHNEWQANFS